MSCRSTVREVVDRCTGWASDTSKECSEGAETTKQECVERAEVDIEGCDEYREEREKECDEKEWVDCDIPFVCDGLNAVAGWVCKGWTWVTHKVCVAPTLIVAGTCIVWETVVNAACQVVTIVVRGACELGGALVTAFVCPVADFVAVRILSSSDEPRAESVPRLSADSMSVAHVASERSYKDSGQRYFFRIRDGGVAEMSTLDSDWKPIAPEKSEPRAISYHLDRDPPTTPAPKFDMIAANSGRVIVKEKHWARFYVVLLEPMFRRAGNVAVPSAYFKLDPEQGQPDADNQDRLVHLQGVGDPNAHPATVRFPLFRKLMEIDFVDMMIVKFDRRLRVWHRVDGRPPSDGGAPPTAANFPPTETVVSYGSSLTRVFPWEILGHKQKRGYRVSRVLDIGVGHEHWHEQRCSIYGGEMDSLDGPGLEPCLKGRNAYRLFNGPVEDQGGFIDNTINYYVLGQFNRRTYGDDDDVPRGAFGILWLDEQAVLSERWRLLDPADATFGLFKDLVPSAVVQYLEKDFRHFKFDRSKYWCPLRAKHATSQSRMAVSRQVVVLSGRDPKTKDWELYSIHAAFGTWDRTWRWRKLPIARRDGRIPAPEAFGLREDMTLYVRETCPDGARVWFQRYLPADEGLMRPRSKELELEGSPVQPPARNLELAKPDDSIGHCWQWLPAEVFEFCHRHTTHFGCYQASVDWRWQYYRAEVLEGEELLLARGEDTCWVDVDRQLSIHKECIDWERLNAAIRGEGDVALSSELLARILVLSASIPGTAAGGLSAAAIEALFRALDQWDGLDGVRDLLCDFYRALRDDGHFIRDTHHEGLFNEGFHLRLLSREPYGWIVTHFDKRDDDLLPFQLKLKDGEPVEVVLRPLGETSAAPRVVLGLRTHTEVRDIPRVCRAKVTIERGREGGRLRLRLLLAVPAQQVDQNLWRVKIGCVQRTQAGALQSFVTRFDRTRLSADRRSVEASGWNEVEWRLDDGEIEVLTACCGAETWRDSGTSLWFEDIVGHVGTADYTSFRVAEIPEG